MRIVIDATAANSGGKVYLDHLLPQLARLAEGHEFIVIHLGDFDGLTLPPSRSRFRFHRVRLPFANSWIGSAAVKMLWRLFVFPARLMRLKPDLLFSNAGFGTGWRFSSIKTVLALHNSMPLRRELIAEERSLPRRLRLVWLRRLMHQALDRADGSIVFSEDSKRRLLEAFPDLRQEPSVVHHGIDWGERERHSPERNGFGLDKPYFLYVSQFHRYKNVTRLIEAFAMLAGKHPELSLALVGESIDRRYWREVTTRAARIGIQHRVKHIPGCERETLIGLYRNALAFVHPSLAETCSFPLLEAMAMGLPIAAARASALPEMAADAAVYFDPHNAVEMAETLDRLIYDEALREELRTKAIRRAAEFSWEETAARTLQVFKQVVNR
jgi:glycosyltransferase involved in cell wall biosynthesis